MSALVSPDCAVKIDVSPLPSVAVGVDAAVSLTVVSSASLLFMETSRSFTETAVTVGAELVESTTRDESFPDLVDALACKPVFARFNFGCSLSEGDLDLLRLPSMEPDAVIPSAIVIYQILK